MSWLMTISGDVGYKGKTFNDIIDILIGSYNYAEDEALLLNDKSDSDRRMIYSEIMVARKIRNFYYICSSAINEKATASRKCMLLHSALDLKDQLPKLFYLRIDCDIPHLKKTTNNNMPMEDLIPVLAIRYKPLLDLPLTEDYSRFYKVYGAELTKKYGIKIAHRAYHKDNGNMPKIQPDKLAATELHYWDNDLAEEDIKIKLFEFVFRPEEIDRQVNAGLDHNIKDITSCELAKVYLNALQEYFNYKLMYQGTTRYGLCFDIFSRNLNIDTYDFADAIICWQIFDISTNKNVKICKMCGNAFESNSKEAKFCKRHNKAQINYYNKCMHAKY